jgi:hypothetical protein
MPARCSKNAEVIAMTESVQGPSPAVTESPWFWLMLFSLAGLAAVATIGPKFERREQSIETKFHARERGLGREGVEQADDATPAQMPTWNPIFTLGPIVGILVVVALVSMFGVIRFHRKKWIVMQNRNPTGPTANPMG